MKNLNFYFLLSAVLCLSDITYAQNLVPNPSFETVTCQTNFALPFGCPISVNSPWIQPSQGSADSFNSCHTGAFGDFGVPSNFQGSQTAHTGVGYGGVMTYEGLGTVYREYIQVALTSPLVAGVTYTVSFYCSLADNSQYASSGLGAYISTGSVTAPTQNNLSYTAQVESTSVITNSTGWDLITGFYTATGGENHITVGNFNNDVNTTTSLVSASAQFNRAFYFIDDVSVSVAAPSGNPISICQGDSVLIGGVYQNTTGTYSDTLTSTTGADSIVTVGLTVVQAYSSPLQSQTICQGDSLLIGNVYYANTGIYIDSLQTLIGCDSIVNIFLDVDQGYINTEGQITVCEGDSALIAGNYYSAPGLYFDSLQTVLGCDSIIGVTLNVNPVYFTTNQSQTICEGDSLLIGGNYYATSGTYVDTLESTVGCDSIVSTTLTVAALPNVSLAAFIPDVICREEGLILLPVGSPVGGVYSGNGVSGSNFDPVNAGLGNHVVSYIFTDANGCMASASSSITVQNCAGIEESAHTILISIYPNPISSNLSIDLGEVAQELTVEIYTMDGKLVHSSAYQNRKLVDIGIDLAKGAYSIVIKADGNITSQKVLKI